MIYPIFIALLTAPFIVWIIRNERKHRREEAVFRFREKVTVLCCENTNRRLLRNEIEGPDAFDWCYDQMPDVETMAASGRALTLEEWIPKETIERLMR